jgi:3-deoxy-D-manno-octulosonate 8-phosphate phosphatase (KDO 8-P phosphatase)
LECDKIAFLPNDLLTGSALLDRARKIKLFPIDIDATLTDGGVCLISVPNNGYDTPF